MDKITNLRMVFAEEGENEQIIAVHVSAEPTEELLQAVEAYCQRQRKRMEARQAEAARRQQEGT